jgi:hypothetical protein
MSVSSVPACEPGQVVHPRLRWFLLALMSAPLNSSVPTPLYPHYQAALALSDLGLSLIYGGYAGACSSPCSGWATWQDEWRICAP